MPEKLIGKIKNNILPQWKMCFWTAIVIGLIAHLYKITNWLPNWDSLVFRYDAQNMVALGRWFLPVVSAPSSFYDLPWLTGLVAIIFHALSAVLICRIFSVKKSITSVLIGAVVVSFPTVTSVMLYNYVADAYAISFFFACLAVYFLVKQKPNYIISAFLIALSVGTYQAYITVTITLILCYLIVEILNNEVNIKTTLIKSAKFLLTGAAGMALYYVAFLIILKVTNITPLEYQGVDNIVTFSNLNILKSLFVIKDLFITSFIDFSNGVNAFSLINIFIFVLTSVIYLSEAIKTKLSVTKFILFLVYIILLPIGAGILSIINSNINYHNIMKMGLVVFYLLFILHYERSSFKTEKLNNLKYWAILIVSSVLIFNQIIIANVSYHKLNISYEKSFGTLVRIADRIEQTENANDCSEILVIGALNDSENYSSTLPPNITGTTDGYILRADDEVVNQSVLCSALNDYCGKNYKFLKGKEKELLLNNSTVKNLNNWPHKNSICVIDNVIVIKLGD